MSSSLTIQHCQIIALNGYLLILPASFLVSHRSHRFAQILFVASNGTHLGSQQRLREESKICENLCNLWENKTSARSQRFVRFERFVFKNQALRSAHSTLTIKHLKLKNYVALRTKTKSSEVSYNELAQTVGTDSKTVEKYVDLLEKCYIIFKLNGFSRNLRTELKRAKKFYFYDNGIRNAILQNFAPLALRQDVGALWENFVISERIKANQYEGRYVNSYFWRTNQQQEIDYIEESDGQFTLFEMKWNPKRANTQFPASFLNTYDVKDKTIITPENWLEHL